MVTIRKYFATFGLAVALTGFGCSRPTPPPVDVTVPPPTAIQAGSDSTEGAIRFLEDKARADPDDFIARNKLVDYYLQRLRETGSVKYLELATRASSESLAAIPAAQNIGGLAAEAQVEFASHEFAAARDHALQLREADPDKLYPLLILGDSLLELGDYGGAADVFRQIEQRGSTSDAGALNAQTRFARLALLQGDPDAARRHFAEALTAAEQMNPAPRETVAWCYWQLGETAFVTGDYAEAERRYADSLTALPDYFRALAGMARVKAAQGDIAGAIAGYERVTRILPDPSFVATLGDLYSISGRDRDAATQYDLVEQIGRLSKLNGVLYNRQLALFRADHDTMGDEAFTSAQREYETRRDIYGADAVAWTALKARRLPEAQSAIADALRLGTRDARLWYHAGMIARAAGDTASARSYLKRALELSPCFDPLQSRVARATLDEMEKGS